MRECYAYIEYEDGTAAIGEYRLKDNLPFALHEMEEWIKKQETSKPIKKVNCRPVASAGKISGLEKTENGESPDWWGPRKK